MDDLYNEEYRSFERSPAWELRNVIRALNMLPWLNGEREIARLRACRDILKLRQRV
jgi:hypothetical protein